MGYGLLQAAFIRAPEPATLNQARTGCLLIGVGPALSGAAAVLFPLATGVAIVIRAAGRRRQD